MILKDCSVAKCETAKKNINKNWILEITRFEFNFHLDHFLQLGHRILFHGYWLIALDASYMIIYHSFSTQFTNSFLIFIEFVKCFRITSPFLTLTNNLLRIFFTFTKFTITLFQITNSFLTFSKFIICFLKQLSTFLILQN